MDLSSGLVLSAFLLSFGVSSEAFPRVYFSKCGLKDFSCTTNANKKLDVVYQCNKDTEGVDFFINQFSGPTNVESLTIRKCKNLNISTRCTSERKPIQKLLISNIDKLSFQNYAYEPMLPPTVVLENIGRIDVIPTNTFAQINRAVYSSGCFIPNADFQNFHLRNVTIDVIRSNAIVGLSQFKNFSFVNVTVKRIQTSAIRLKHDLHGSFEVKNSTIETLESLAIQIYGKIGLFAESSFNDIASDGINGTMEDFYFTNNLVEVLQPQGFSILATNIFILDNHFLHLKSYSLAKLSPGLIQDSGRNFGKLKFVYDFSKNNLNFLDPGSLHPDYISYENVQTEMMFSRNNFWCSCENLGWLFDSLAHGAYAVESEPFYEMVLDRGYENTCVNSNCNLPVVAVQAMLNCRKCLGNLTIHDLCEKSNAAEASSSSTISVNVTTGHIPNELMDPMNYTMSSAQKIISRITLNFFMLLLVILLMY